jgi:hypothetical protein
MNKYRITKISPCPKCNGDCWIQNPAWEQYYEEFGPQGAPTEKEQVTWFLDHWYTDLPDEEVPCWVCEGEGQIVTEVSLRQALEDIGTYRTHQNIDKRLLDLESDIRAIPVLIDSIQGLEILIRGIESLIDEIQDYMAHIDARVSPLDQRRLEDIEAQIDEIQDYIMRNS